MNLTPFRPLALILALAAQGVLAGQSYKFQIVECGDYHLYPKAMNNEGVVVGGAQGSGSADSLAFVYSGGSCRTFGPGPDGVSLTGVADSGAVVGIYGKGDFLIEGGALENLPLYSGSAYSYYCCLNTSTGVLAGNYHTAFSVLQYGFFYANGKFAPLPSSEYDVLSISGVNANGLVVGTANQQYGFTYSDGSIKLFQFPQASYTSFNGINNDGVIVGTYVNLTVGRFGIISYDLETGAWKNLDFGEYAAAIPIGITDSGVIAAALGPSGGLLIATPTN